MPPTLYNVALGVLVGLALLGAAFDRRSILVVAVAAALSDADAVVSLLVDGATNAAFHTVFIPLVVGTAVLWDTMFAEHSRIMDRFGWWGARTAWVALAAWVFAGILPDLASESGVNLFYPLHDQFYSVDGAFYYSTEDGIVQSYIGLGDDHLIAVDRLGTTAEHHVPSWINPTGERGLDLGADRRLSLVETGWQLVVVATAAAALVVRSWEGA